jgi:hypothetical protein
MKEGARLSRESCAARTEFHERLNSYALAAGAAGVSILALVNASEAKIIYTRTHHVIGNNSSFRLDLNHDGVTDLTFQNKFVQTCTTDAGCTSHQALAGKLVQGNQVVYNAYGAVAMKQGMEIGPKYAFRGGVQNMASVGILGPSSAWGSWINVKNRYLGVMFKINGKTHYGWARLSVQVPQELQVTATLTGFAYETVPNKPIIAGNTKDDVADTISGPDAATPVESSSIVSLIDPTPKTTAPTLLGMLALGAGGLRLWRRRSPPR